MHSLKKKKTVKSQKVLVCIGLFDNFSLESEFMTALGKKAERNIKEDRKQSPAADGKISQFHQLMDAGRDSEKDVRYVLQRHDRHCRETHTRTHRVYIKQFLYTHLVVVVHAGEVSPAFVASDLNETLKETEDIRTCYSLRCAIFSEPRC